MDEGRAVAVGGGDGGRTSRRESSFTSDSVAIAVQLSSQRHKHRSNHFSGVCPAQRRFCSERAQTRSARTNLLRASARLHRALLPSSATRRGVQRVVVALCCATLLSLMPNKLQGWWVALTHRSALPLAPSRVKYGRPLDLARNRGKTRPEDRRVDLIALGVRPDNQPYQYSWRQTLHGVFPSCQVVSCRRLLALGSALLALPLA